MIVNITNSDGYISGEASLPFFGHTVKIELDSESQEELAFAERQLALLSALPKETYVALCRHSVDYAADLVDYVGEYLGMFDEKYFEEELLPPIKKGDYSELSSLLERWFTDQEAEQIISQFKSLVQEEQLNYSQILKLIGQIVLDLELYTDNFPHVWPVVQQDLEENPLHILRFVRLLNVHFDHLADHGKEVLAANLEFECDWEPEHGMIWSIVKSTGVYVRDASDFPSLTSVNYEDYDDDDNYCFHKSLY